MENKIGACCAGNALVFMFDLFQCVFKPVFIPFGRFADAIFETFRSLLNLTFKNLASYLQEGRTTTLQMLYLIYIFFNKYKY
jgi:hypothetical protein